MRLENLLREKRRFEPPAEFAAKANAQPSVYDEAAADRVEDLLPGLGPYQRASSFYRYALAQQAITESSFPLVTRPKVPGESTTVGLSRAELRRLLRPLRVPRFVAPIAPRGGTPVVEPQESPSVFTRLRKYCHIPLRPPPF